MTDSGYFLLNIDAGMDNSGRRAKGDPPGEAAIGVVLKRLTEKRRELPVDSFGKAIGPAKIHVAEYTALVEGLKTALEHEAKYVRAYMDSEFVVEQINNSSPPDSKDLTALYEEAQKLITNFASSTGFRLSWIPRSRNGEADKLTQEARDGN